MSINESLAINQAELESLLAPFDAIEEKLRRFSLDDFNDEGCVKEYADTFSIHEVCNPPHYDDRVSGISEMNRGVTAYVESPFRAEYDDLCRLHWLTLSRKIINTLEFGSGYSTAVMADAMRILAAHFADWALENVRSDQPFHLHSIEEEQRFVEISSSRLGERLAPFATVRRSSVELILHDNRIATVFAQLPNLSPDLIYIDGPSQFATTQSLNGFSFTARSRMPMSADVLRFEFFLEPGTLIIVDGRSQNAAFLRAYLKRNWVYRHDPAAEIHYFELQEPPLGPLSERKMAFRFGGSWLLS